MYLYDKLNLYAKEDYYPFHMPGHKRNLEVMEAFNPYAIDITEIDGFDNLHDAEDVILKSMQRAARLYESENTFFLVNGSTSGILTGISACTNKGDKILMARNCHKAAYHAVFLNELEPVYVYPQFNHKEGIQCGYCAKSIERMLIKHSDIRLIVLVSPTYEGVVSEIKGICEFAHERKIPVLVDEAHGAHFKFHEAFPDSALDLGADVVIQSVHKTLPSFTQTALLHVNSHLVDSSRIRKYASIYQTSSPSYVLMAGIDKCMEMIERQGKKLFDQFIIRLKKFYKETEKLKHLRIIGYRGRDISKIVISTKKTTMTGSQLYDILLWNYKIQLEMSEAEYAIAIATIMDTETGFTRLRDALFEIDETLVDKENSNVVSYAPVEAKVKLLQHQAFLCQKKKCILWDSVNEISANFVNLYPPGIPILAPGELITREIVEHIKAYMDAGLSVKGLIEKEYVLVINREDERCQKYLL